MDNINFYSNGIPAGQQTDSYTTQPGCLLSKNVDIFSSSKSIKATAFSEPVAEGDSSVVASDGGLELRTDGKIYDSEGTLVVDPAANFPSYPISYTGKDGTYAPATFGTPQSMSVATDGNTWQSVAVFTDRTIYNYSKVPYIVDKKMDRVAYCTYQGIDPDYGYMFKRRNSDYPNSRGLIQIFFTINCTHQTKPFKVRIKLDRPSEEWDIRFYNSNYKYIPEKYYYDVQADLILSDGSQSITLDTSHGSIFDEDGLLVDVPTVPGEQTLTIWLRNETTDSYSYDGTIYIDMNGLVIDETASDYTEQKNHLMAGYTGDYNEYYGYEPIKDRYLKKIGEYYWLKGDKFQTFYKREPLYTDYVGQQLLRYEFVGEMSWETPIGMDVVAMIEYKEQVFMIGNKEGNGYIIPGDLSGGKGVATIFYGIQFFGAVNKDYLIYLCGTDRGVSTLWAYNGQELVPVISGSQEINAKDLIDYVEQYRFDGSMVIYRNNLVLGTTDNRLFRYGQTYGGRGGSFIYVLPSGATLTELEAIGNDLKVHYTLNNTKYYTVYQDDVPIQRFNTEYEVVYPIQIGNHIIEKEDTDLYVSYLLPSANTSLEFWAMNNHYQYWTFTSEENVTLDTTKNYTMSGAGGTYALKFIERNGNQYTFELDGNLPVQTSNEMKIKDNENTVVLNYTSYNHFRLIGTLSTDKCEESKFRFTGLNNKLNLTKTHSMQIMVKGKGTTQYTPELFALNLVATQRDRG